MASEACESCGAAIIWIKDQNGTRLPVNKTRVRTYVPDGDSGRWLYNVGESDHPVDGKPKLSHISHFLTCPNATQHSKKS